MHKTRPEARAFAQALSHEIESRPLTGEIVIAPPLTLLDSLSIRPTLVARLPNVAEREGAYTGEVSAIQCFDAGCRWATSVTGRRREFGETRRSSRGSSRGAAR
jgi:triosephosphate isomerase